MIHKKDENMFQMSQAAPQIVTNNIGTIVNHTQKEEISIDDLIRDITVKETNTQNLKKSQEPMVQTSSYDDVVVNKQRNKRLAKIQEKQQKIQEKQKKKAEQKEYVNLE